MALTESQLYVLQVTERTCSVLSLLGAAFIISTFVFDKAFHKPINRLVFYACWGNVMANIGTLISTSGPSAGDRAPLCQFQGFLIQMFMPADALWTLSMALNVYLTFFRKYNAYQLKALEWKYIVFCYGIPFIPAFIYLFIEPVGRGKIYGSAVMWCWISIEWDVLRVAVFYAPIWVVILITFTIYLWAGKEIFEKRRMFRNISEGRQVVDDGRRLSVIQNPFLVPGITKTTEIKVTSQPNLAALSYGVPTGQKTIPTNDQIRNMHSHQPSYNITIEGGQKAAAGSKQGLTSYSPPLFRRSPGHKGLNLGRVVRPNRATSAANKAAFSYCKCASLFFVSLLLTWVPSSINRVYQLVHPDKLIWGFTLASGMVLPLQGFWNCVIYIMTSKEACSKLFERLRGKIMKKREESLKKWHKSNGESDSLKKSEVSEGSCAEC